MSQQELAQVRRRGTNPGRHHDGPAGRVRQRHALSGHQLRGTALAEHQRGDLGGGVAPFYQDGDGAQGRLAEKILVLLQPAGGPAQLGPRGGRCRVAAEQGIAVRRIRRQQVVSSGSPGVDQGEFQGIVGNHLSLGNTCIAVREIGKKGCATGEESLRPGDEITVGIDPCALAGAAGETSVGISGAGPRSRPDSRFDRQEIPGWQRAGLIAADETDRISVKRIGAGGAAGGRDTVFRRREPDGIDPSAREEAGAIGIGIPTEHDLVQQINSHE